MKTRVLWAPLLLVVCAACGPRVTVQTPPGFAVRKDQEECVYRAATADGVAFAVRAEKNEPHGNLDFWSKTLDNQLRRIGYTPEGPAADVRTAGGLTGRELKYTRVEGGRKYRFWLAVFVTESRVWVVETGGDEERFNGAVPAGVQKAIESLGVG
jgi:hypothetical protein